MRESGTVSAPSLPHARVLVANRFVDATSTRPDYKTGLSI